MLRLNRNVMLQNSFESRSSLTQSPASAVQKFRSLKLARRIMLQDSQQLTDNTRAQDSCRQIVARLGSGKNRAQIFDCVQIRNWFPGDRDRLDAITRFNAASLCCAACCDTHDHRCLPSPILDRRSILRPARRFRVVDPTDHPHPIPARRKHQLPFTRSRHAVHLTQTRSPPHAPPIAGRGPTADAEQ